jgi:LytR cell envelope-related transcriptional attenuator
VDHPLSSPDALVRPWRTAAYIAGTVAAVELLLLLVLGGGALLGAVSSSVQVAAKEHARAEVAQPKPVARKPEKIAPAKTPRRKIAVVVLNGNGRTGAAASAATRVKSRGYKIRSVGNAPRSDFARSIVMFRPGFAGEGRRLARDLGVRQVSPLDGIRLRDLRGAHAVYILGA